MEYNIYCIRDEKLVNNLYGAIMLQENDQIAIRGFKSEVNKKGNMWNDFPSDFSLWCVGTYYMATGEIVPELRKVCDAASLIDYKE